MIKLSCYIKQIHNLCRGLNPRSGLVIVKKLIKRKVRYINNQIENLKCTENWRIPDCIVVWYFVRALVTSLGAGDVIDH